MVVHQDDTDDMIRGKALVLHFRLLSTAVNSLRQVMPLTTPQMRSFISSYLIETLTPTLQWPSVQNYLLNQARQRGIPPNVNCLYLHL
jgi:hypothetical protein